MEIQTLRPITEIRKYQHKEQGRDEFSYFVVAGAITEKISDKPRKELRPPSA